jgi:ADP-ribose pyrophosphatase YjhB (NUDIX family)
MQREIRSKRAYPNRPLIGVGGVVLRGDELLLVRRGMPPSQGLWSLPGGALELGEELSAGLEREIREECGISIQIGPIVGVFDAIFPDQDDRVQYHYVLIDFLADYLAGELIAGSDASEAIWTPFTEYLNFDLVEGTRQFLANIQANLPGLRSDRDKPGVLYGRI